jgi:CDP-diacylglycerol--serine O-phosphatidyltransferase
MRTVAVFPTLLTLGNLVCGFFAIVVASRVDKPDGVGTDLADTTNVMMSGWLIFLGMVFDALDGYVARLSRTSSDFGAQLDSLCDLVTFGVAPAFLLVKICPRFAYMHRHAIWVIAAAYAVCVALRLARFTLESTEDDDHMHFSGLPSPAGAAAIASFAIMFYTLRKDENPLIYAQQIDHALQIVLPFFALLVAGLMVSRVPYPHVVNQVVRGQRSFAHVVAVVFTVAAIMMIRGYAVPLVCCAFVLSGPVRYAWQRYVERRERRESLF